MRVISLITDIGVTQSTLLLILNRLLPKVELEPLTDEIDLTQYAALFIVGLLPADNDLYLRVKKAGLQLIGFYVTNPIAELDRIQLNLFDRLFFPEVVSYKTLQALGLTKIDIIPHPLHMLDGKREKRWELSMIGFIYQPEQRQLAEQVMEIIGESNDIVLIPIGTTLSLASIGQISHIGLALTFDSSSSRLAIIGQIPYVRIVAASSTETLSDRRWYQLSNVPTLDKSLFRLLFDSVERTYNKMINYLSTFQRRAQNILCSGKIYESLLPPKIVDNSDGHDTIGWPSTMDHLRSQFPSIIIVGDVSLHFRHSSIYTVPWIGFIHSFDDDIWQNKEFLISLYHCRALLTACDKHGSVIKSQLKKFNLKLSILTFKYPFTSMHRFSLNSFLNNQSRGFVEPLKPKMRPLFFASLYSPFLKKKSVSLPELTNLGDIGEVLIREGLIKRLGSTLTPSLSKRVESILSSVELLDSTDYLNDHLVFINGDEEEATDIIIKCIASNTPVITTSNSRTVQLLGENYPFLLTDGYEGLLKVNIDHLEKALNILIKRETILGDIHQLLSIISSLKM